MLRGDRFEARSGKGAGDENFPVGSVLLAPSVRPHVAAFYAFARAADDVADAPHLGSDEKCRRLDAFEGALLGREAGPSEARRLRESLAATRLGPRHARDLLAAFRQDATVRRYTGWDALIAYCMLSAAPVGRYLLDLHGESQTLWPAADALCCALQILNHLQDCRADYEALDRVYLPESWMCAAGMRVAELRAAPASPRVRAVLDRALDETVTLIAQAHPLPRLLADRRLAMEARTIIGLADRLAARLAARDPIVAPVALRWWDFLICGVHGAILGLARRRPSADGADRVRPVRQKPVAQDQPQPGRAGEDHPLVEPVPAATLQAVEQPSIAHHHHHRRP